MAKKNINQDIENTIRELGFKLIDEEEEE